MFDGYCWAYRKAVRHMNTVGFVGVLPEGDARADLSKVITPYLTRMSKSEFTSKYCKDCSASCKIREEIASKRYAAVANTTVLINPVTQEQTVVRQSRLTDIFNEVFYFDVPDENVEMAKVVGRIQHPIEDISLFCQALVTDLDGYYISLLYFDYRDFGKSTILYDNIDKVHIKMNVAGEFTDYGIYPVHKMKNKETFMVVFNIGEVDFEDAVYRTKAAFKRVADRVFEEVV
jgi:hypothetical protein